MKSALPSGSYKVHDDDQTIPSSDVTSELSRRQGPLYPWECSDISTGASCNRSSRFQDKYSMKDLPSTPSSHKMVSIRVLYIGVLHQDAISTFLLPRDIQPYGYVQAASLGTHKAKHLLLRKFVSQ